jgi:four helix bundle protein
VVSIVENTAEGFSRYTFADKANRYVIARGECGEVQAFLYVAERLLYIDKETAARARHHAEEVGRILSGLIASCRRHQS